MGRTIITEKDIQKSIMPGDIKRAREERFRKVDQPIGKGPATGPSVSAQKADDYISKLIKYIPTEVIALYILIESLVKSAGTVNMSLYWILFAVIIIATPLYLWRIQKVDKYLQLAISTIALIVWVFAIGGPFAYQSWYQPYYGGILAALYSFAIPIIDP